MNSNCLTLQHHKKDNKIIIRFDYSEFINVYLHFVFQSRRSGHSKITYIHMYVDVENLVLCAKTTKAIASFKDSLRGKKLEENYKKK